MKELKSFKHGRTTTRAARGHARASIDRCDICRERNAVYRSAGQETKICEHCYRRLAREHHRDAWVV